MNSTFDLVPEPREEGRPELGAVAQCIAALLPGSGRVRVLTKGSAEDVDLKEEDKTTNGLGAGVLVVNDYLEHFSQPGAALSDVLLNSDAEAVLVCLPERELMGRVPKVDSGVGKPRGWTFSEGRELMEGIPGYEVVYQSLTLTSPKHLERHASLFILVAKGGALPGLRRRLETGMASFAFAGLSVADSLEGRPKVAIVTEEVYGPSKCGGIGTAYTSLAEHLGKCGHDVTVLFIGQVEKRESLKEWERYYAARQVTFEPLDVTPLEGKVPWEQEYLRKSYLSYRWLVERDRDEGAQFDVIHFPECNGFGFYTAHAKQSGIAFEQTTLCIGTHGSTRWANGANHIEFFSSHQLIQDHMEKSSLAGCDVLAGPSLYLIHWMQNRGWELPGAVYQQQYIQPHSARVSDEEYDPLTAPRRSVVEGFNEIVFFGRLETRKGLLTLCDALDRLVGAGALNDSAVITLLGKDSLVDGVVATKYVFRRAKEGKWPWKVNPLTDRSQTEAVEYLQGDGRLVVVPSLVDNSPNTVYECIGLGVPFLTGGNSGIVELMHPEDVAGCTFYDREEVLRGRSLSRAIGRAFVEGVRPPRPAICQVRNEEVHERWHRAEAAKLRKRGEESEGRDLVKLSACIPYQGEWEELVRLLRDLKAANITEVVVAARKGMAAEVKGIDALVIECDEEKWFGGLVTEGCDRIRGNRILVVRPGHRMQGDWARMLSASNADLVMGISVLENGGSEDGGLRNPAKLDHFPVGGAALLPLVMDVSADVPFVMSEQAFDKMDGVRNYVGEKRLGADFFVEASVQHGLEVAVVPEVVAVCRDTRPKEGSSADYRLMERMKTALRGCFAGPAEEFFPGFVRGLEQRLQKATGDFWGAEWRASEAERRVAESDELRIDRDKWKKRSKEDQQELKTLRREVGILRDKGRRNLWNRLQDSVKKRVG